MNSNSRDIQILEKMLGYCDEINEAIDLFSDSYEVMRKTSAYKNATAMCVLQIGELAGHLSDEFKAKYSEVPWKQIKGMRNIMAHRYGKLDVVELWNTVKIDIPELRGYCLSVLDELRDS